MDKTINAETTYLLHIEISICWQGLRNRLSWPSKNVSILSY